MTVRVPFVDAIEDITGGSAKLARSEYREAGRLPVVDQGKRLISGYTDDPRYLFKFEGQHIIFGDHTRAVKYVDFPFVMGADGVKVLRARNNFDPKYVYHYLRTVTLPDAGYSRHFKFLKAIQLPLAPLGEQRRIAAILDRADELSSKCHEVVARWHRVLSAVFIDSVRDCSQRLSLAELGIDFVSGKNVVADDAGAHPTNRVIKVSAISTGSFDPIASKPMPLDYAPPAAHRLAMGDILFGRASGSLELLGATAVVDQRCENLFLPDKVWRLEIAAESPIDEAFGLGILRSDEFLAYVRHNASGAAGVRNIAKSKLLLYRAPVATPQQQQHFALESTAERKQARLAAAAAKSADELFASLQSRAFRGEL